MRLPWELRSPAASLVTASATSAATTSARRAASRRAGSPRRTAAALPAIAHQASFGADIQLEAVNGLKRDLYAPAATEASESVRTREVNRAKLGEDLPTSYPGVLRARRVSTKSGEFGYLRIFSFSAQNADDFVREVIRLLAKLPQNGLILDVRNNGGGLIMAAEQLLQLFTPRHIELRYIHARRGRLRRHVGHRGGADQGASG